MWSLHWQIHQSFRKCGDCIGKSISLSANANFALANPSIFPQMWSLHWQTPESFPKEKIGIILIRQNEPVDTGSVTHNGDTGTGKRIRAF